MGIVLQAILVALIGGIAYSIIGVIPGTDEGATMAPITLVLVLMGFEPVVLLAWIVSISVAMQITHTIPTAMAALPGSTMAVPMVSYCNTAKALGIPHIAMRKLASGSLIGSVVALPIAIGLATVLKPLGPWLSANSGIIFTIGAVIIALTSKAKWGGVVAIIPFAFLIQGLQRLAGEAIGSNLSTTIFMGITIGPMISELFNILIPERRKEQARDSYKEIWLAPESKAKGSFFVNPFKYFGKKQVGYVVGASALSSCTFTMSPVGMTVLLGELVAGRKKELYDRTTTVLGVQDAVSNATYIAELIIPMLAFGLPITGCALGGAYPLFSTINLHDYLVLSDYIIYGIIGLICGAIFAYPISMRYARQWTAAMFRHVSHEALIGAFVGLVLMLSFHEAGLFGVLGALFIGTFGGILNNIFRVHTGIQFMAFYASGWIVNMVIAATAFIR